MGSCNAGYWINVLRDSYAVYADKWRTLLDKVREGEYNEDLRFVFEGDNLQIKCAKRLDVKTFLPAQPFIGNPEAPIWMVNLNPWYNETDRYDYLNVSTACKEVVLASIDDKKKKDRVRQYFNEDFDAQERLKRRQMLFLDQFRLRSCAPFYFLDQSYKTDLPGGFKWWQDKLFGKCDGFFLNKLKGEGQNELAVATDLVFALELFPYHSKHFWYGVLEDANWQTSMSFKTMRKVLHGVLKTKEKVVVVRSEKGLRAALGRVLYDDVQGLYAPTRTPRCPCLTEKNVLFKELKFDYRTILDRHGIVIRKEVQK